MQPINLFVKLPFSFPALLNRLQSHPDEQLRVDPAAQTIQRVFRLNNRLVLATIRFLGDVEQPAMEVQVHEAISDGERNELVASIRHMFSTDVDLEPVYGHMANDPHLRMLTERFRGLRFCLEPDLFACMVRTIIGQQVNLTFAANLTHSLLELAGDRYVTEDGHTFHVFPTPEAIARLDVSHLRPLKFSQRKAEYIIDFARAVAEGKVELDKLDKMSDEEVIAYLTPLRGIGRWSVECLLMFGMGRPDLLPAADIGLRNGIQLVYGIAEKIDEKTIREIGESWKPYRSYVSLYMWEAIGAKKRGEWEKTVSH